MSSPDPWNNGTRFAQDLLNWQPPLNSADADFKRGWQSDRARARELSWRDPYGLNSVTITQDALVGKHFRLSLKPDADALGVDDTTAHTWAQMMERDWRRYAEGVTFDADAKRQNTFTLQMRTVVGAFHMDGEALGIVQAKEGHAGYTTCLQLIEAERLTDPTDVASRSKRIRHGIESDDMGEPIAYHIRKRHPSDAGWVDGVGLASQVERVPRSTSWGRPIVLHLYDEPRPAMSRGVARFVAVARQMKQLATYSEAELERNIIQASFGAVIESQLDYEEAMALLGAKGGSTFGNNLTDAAMDHLKTVAPFYKEVGLKVGGSRVVNLIPGESVKLLQPQGMATDYEKFEAATLRQLAAGLNVPYESLARNFSDTSYSAARMSLADIWRSFLTRREMISQKFAMPFVSAWMEECLVTGRQSLPNGKLATLEEFCKLRHALVRGGFISWTKPLIDPVKERTAQQMGMALGLTTMEAEAAADGDDWDELLMQRKREKERRKELKLDPEDLDPTLMFSGAGARPKTSGPAKNTQGGNTAE